MNEGTWTGHVELSHAQCWRMLGEFGIGHLGLRAHPVGVDVLPIDYRITDRQLYFRTNWGTKLAEAMEHPHVAVQVDRFSGNRWFSVVLKGEAERVLDDQDVAASGARAIQPHDAGGKDFVVRIRPTAITGRSFPVEGGRIVLAAGTSVVGEAVAREAALE